MISEGVVAVSYGASAEDIGRTSHAHVRLLFSVYVARLYFIVASRHLAKHSRKQLWQHTVSPFMYRAASVLRLRILWSLLNRGNEWIFPLKCDKVNNRVNVGCWGKLQVV
jgi:hypothetical protein